MNSDELESRLQRTPLRQPPAEWREEILVASLRSQRCESLDQSIRELTSLRDATPRQAFAATWRMRVRELLWPHPVAWGAMAAVWLALGAVQVALREPHLGTPPLQVTETPEAPTLLNLQSQWLWVLNEPMDRPKPAPIQALPPQSAIERSRDTLEA